MIFPVCAMADESAIFIRDTQVTCLGEIKDFSPNMIMRGRDAREALRVVFEWLVKKRSGSEEVF